MRGVAYGYNALPYICTIHFPEIGIGVTPAASGITKQSFLLIALPPITRQY